MKKLLLSLVIGSATITPNISYGQDEPGPNTGAISFSASQTITSSYFFRGYNQEDIGLIYQPGVAATISILDSDDLDITATIGTWNSFHSEQTGSTNTWYESDIYGSLDFAFGPVTASALYTFYFYPGGAGDTIQELTLRLGYDDSALMESAGVPFTLSPYVLIAIETDDGNGTEDTYGEIGVSPAFALGDTGLTLTIPLVLGVSIDDFYVDSDGDNEFFGYGMIGAKVTIPLTFVPARYGEWSVDVGGNYLLLFADSVEMANDPDGFGDGEDYEIQGYVTLNWSY